MRLRADGMAAGSPSGLLKTGRAGGRVWRPVTHCRRHELADLTPQQCQLIEGQIRQRWQYLDQLLTRMRQQHFPRATHSIVAVVNAHTSLQQLADLLHLRSAPIVSPPPRFDYLGPHPGMPPKRND